MPTPEPAVPEAFPSTHWTLVRAVQQGSAEESAHALDEICKSYWYPIYAYLRRSGHGEHDAQDLTQAFFQRLISQKALLTAEQQGGKLRSWLLGVLKRQLSDHGRYHGAQKRGGGIPHLSFDEFNGEDRYALEPTEPNDPDALYTRVWAQDLIAGVRKKLREAYTVTGRAEVFDQLLPYLVWDKEPPSSRELAQAIGTSEVGARILIHRLRVKFRTLLNAEVAQTVMSADEIPAELAWLRSLLAGE